MEHQSSLKFDLGYTPCKYGSSRLAFRGPAKSLSDRYVAFLGGSETFGRFLDQPYPDLVEEETGVTCVNFAQINGSVEAALHDTLIPNACRDAKVTVLSVTGAANVSNRLYSVHPRRNDRFVKPSAALRSLYPEMDFTEICFTRHLLVALQAAGPDRFEVVREELRTAWLSRMRTFLDRVGPNVVLLWCAPSQAEDQGDTDDKASFGPLGPDPLFVTRSMVQSLRTVVRKILVVPVGGIGPAGQFGPETHAAVASAVAKEIKEIVGAPKASAPAEPTLAPWGPNEPVVVPPSPSEPLAATAAWPESGFTDKVKDDLLSLHDSYVAWGLRRLKNRVAN